jgi:hypothetical protein
MNRRRKGAGRGCAAMSVEGLWGGGAGGQEGRRVHFTLSPLLPFVWKAVNLGNIEVAVIQFRIMVSFDISCLLWCEGLFWDRGMRNSSRRGGVRQVASGFEGLDEHVDVD